MLLAPAQDHEIEAIAAFVNRAYRGDASRAGWASEADMLGGQRTDAAALREDLAAPGAVLLTFRDDAAGPLLGCVWLQPLEDGAWYLGMLTIDPRLQARQLGRALLAAAEAWAAERGAGCIRMTVIWLRESLIAWYRRRGYALTGATEPFPYGDERFGIPNRDDLHFVVMEKAL
ncbi:MAG: GNAT family N-acetyltransferase [Caulobacteraceae bacterium]|nr:GNAT family N-acetyltransferase [Caulobacteraceae bacterium]